MIKDERFSRFSDSDSTPEENKDFRANRFDSLQKHTDRLLRSQYEFSRGPTLPIGHV